MIIVQLSGGFGNQLFQYACGLSLGEHHKVQVKVDASLLSKPDAVTGTIRHADIFNLAKRPQEATEQEMHFYNNLSLRIKYIDKSLPFHKRRIYKEKSNTFDGSFFKAGSDLLLKGNRQSEKYFKRYETKIRSDFSLSEHCISAVKKYFKEFEEQNSISIHIRRGDYLTPVALEWLGLLPISYYTNAFARTVEKGKDNKFYIFSDDIEWAKQNLKIEYKHEFVSGVITKNSMEDFYLMSQCKHNIIANSTFSWWAAWLNSNPDKIVIAPKKWYSKANLDTKDLIPDEWIQI